MVSKWQTALVGAVLLSFVTLTVGAAPAAVGARSEDNAKPVVGVYYYPWFRKPPQGRAGQWRHVMRQRLASPQAPKLGLYDSNDPNVVGEHIAQSLRGRIAFWAVSWWGPGHHTDQTFRQAILPHPDAGKLKYAVLYESTGRLGSLKAPHYRHWIDDLAYLEKTYFDHPYYLKVQGRPVVFVYLTRVYFRDKGQDALRRMRERFPRLYLVGDDVFGPGYEARWARPFDAITAYDVYGQSVGRLGGTRKAIDFLTTNYQHAKAAANGVGTAFMPTVAPGYNDTAVRDGHPGRARYFTDVEDSREGDIFRAMLREVALPHLDPRCGRIMMVTSFNEWYEDTQIEATAGTAAPSTTDDSPGGTAYTGGDRYVDYGHLYLDLLRDLVQ